jgi:hypothetical protein
MSFPWLSLIPLTVFDRWFPSIEVMRSK